jgi:hypothetical protein
VLARGDLSYGRSRGELMLEIGIDQQSHLELHVSASTCSGA